MSDSSTPSVLDPALFEQWSKPQACCAGIHCGMSAQPLVSNSIHPPHFCGNCRLPVHGAMCAERVNSGEDGIELDPLRLQPHF